MPKFQNIQVDIIDLDGTLLETAPDFLVAINHMRTASLYLHRIRNQPQN
jgi:phosphoglycolate phosphatase-like HAD superfamily hydrolase